jgi:hypothetical protein
MFEAKTCVEGECVFCRQTKEGLQVEWKDRSFPPGLLCWTCLKKAARMKSEKRDESAED